MTLARRLGLWALGLAGGWVLAPLPSAPVGVVAPPPAAPHIPGTPAHTSRTPCPDEPPPPPQVARLREAVAQLEATLTDELGVAQPFTAQVPEAFRPESLHELLEEVDVEVLTLDCAEYPCLVEIARPYDPDLDAVLRSHGVNSTDSTPDAVVLRFADPNVPPDEHRWAHRVRMLQTWGTTPGDDGLP